MEKERAQQTFENVKEEGELSDEDEFTPNITKSRFRNGTNPRSTSVSKSGHNRTPFVNTFVNSNWARYKSETQFNRKGSFQGPLKINKPLPSLMDIKAQPSKNFHTTNTARFSGNLPRLYHPTMKGNAYNNTTFQTSKPTLPSSPASRLWENRRLRCSKEEAEKKVEEDDFETLLKKYRDIQGKLADIRKEEETVDPDKAVHSDDPATGTEAQTTADTSDKESDHWTIDAVSSPIMSEGTSPVIDMEDSSPAENLGTSDMSKTMDNDDVDDEELDELELRRIALASAAEKMRLAEVDENSNRDSQSQTPAVDQEKQSGSTRSQSAARKPTKPPQKESKSKIVPHKSKYSKLQSRFLRARTPAIRPRKPFSSSPRQASDMRQRDYRLHRPAAESRTRQNHTRNRPGANKLSDVGSGIGDKSRDTSAEKTREIQKILLLDDPKEQVTRFLALVNKTGQSEKKSKTSAQVGKKEALEQSKDNYEEVEMDIDSDPDSRDAANPVEELFEPDFYSAMQPMYLPAQPVYEAYDPVQSWSLPLPSFSATSLAQYQPHSVVDLPAAPSQSDSQIHPGYGIPENSYIPTANIIDFQPPLPPPPPADPPPAPPPLPPSLPPLPSSPSPPPLPTEPPPPPPPPEIEEPSLPKPCSLEERIQAVLRTYSEASKVKEKQPGTVKLERNSPVATEAQAESAISESYFLPSTATSMTSHNNFIPSGTESVTNNISDRIYKATPKERHVDVENFSDTKNQISGIKISVISTKQPTPTDNHEQRSGQLFSAKSCVKEEEEEDAEEEEAQLRARLLQSLAARKKEKEKLEATTQNDSSPNLSRSQSPSAPYIPARISQKVPYPKIHLGNLPTQKPVVIRLGEDSSDEEGESRHLVSPPVVEKYLGGLDSFLKEARRSSEMKSVGDINQASPEKLQQELKRKADLAAKVRLLESDLMKHNERITKDQGLLKVLVSRASKYLHNVKITEQKVKLLTEQLAAAEKVVTANKEALEKAKKQARLVKDGLLKKKISYEEMQRCLLEMGRELHGPAYKIGMGAAAGRGGSRRVESTDIPLALAQQPKHGPKKNVHRKRQLNEIKITIANTDKTATTSSSKQKLTSEEIAQEKARLQKLAKEYEKKIQLLKNSQHVGKQHTSEVTNVSDKQQVPNAEERRDENISNSILKLEKIELGTDAIDLTSDAETEVVKHRRSLMEMNPSTRPDLTFKASVTRQNSREEEKNNVEVQIPDNKVLLKLLKMQKSQFDEYLRRLSQHWLNSTEDRDYAALEHKPQQIAKLTVFRGTGKMHSAGTTTSNCDFKYKSPLLHFRAYRFSPYFRTRALRQLRSKTIAHKILPKKRFCRFDLKGTCNDENCLGQHEEHYTLSDREVLLDIVSYCPALTGVQNAMPAKTISKVMGDYVDTMLKQHQGRLTLDELCLLLISRVNERAKHVRPHTMFYTSRLFRPKQDEKQFESIDTNFKENVGEEFVWKPFSIPDSKMSENVVLEGDRRYFYSDGSCEVQDLETAVMASPKHTQLWLKLANKKLHNPTLPVDQCLDQALNALARGVEENKNSSELWLEYLGLYAQHKEARDYTELCQTALHYAPNFEIWWLYLHSLVSYTDRNEVCSEVIDYLCSVQSADQLNPSISHHLLETMLYKVHLSVLAGQPQYAKNILQGFFVKSEGKPACQSKLTVEDRSVLWLCYIHLMSWQELPTQLWDPANQLSGKIAHKKLCLPWHKLMAPDFSASQQMALLEEAINVCIGEATTDITVLQDGMVLYRNMIQLLQAQNKLEEVLTVCRDLLQRDQSLVDIWLLVTNLYASNGETQAATQVFSDAMEVNPFSAKVFNFAANFEISLKTDGAMKILESFPCGFFVQENNLDDPQSLYSVLLKQTLPVGYVVPEYKPEISEDIIAKQQPYLWLNYCLFLEQLNDYATVVEMYETALSAMSDVKDVTKIWKGYLKFLYRQIVSHPESETHCQKLNQLFHRCIVTVPVKLPLRHWPGKMFEDYRYINKIIDLYLGCTIPENRPVVLERLINMMPSNVDLVMRACVECLKLGEEQRALSLCYPLLHEGTANTQLWKLLISLASKQSPKVQIRKQYQLAVQRMPYDLSLWKDFLVSEMVRGEAAKEMIKAIVQHCQILGLNTGELIQLLKTS